MIEQFIELMKPEMNESTFSKFKCLINSRTFSLEELLTITGDIIEGKTEDEKLFSFNNSNIWDNFIFNKIKNKIYDQDNLLENYEIVEGVLKCNKCGSKKIYNISIQTRSCDEGASTKAICINCMNKWMIKS